MIRLLLVMFKALKYFILICIAVFFITRIFPAITKTAIKVANSIKSEVSTITRFVDNLF